jgi:hypothetical protein
MVSASGSRLFLLLCWSFVLLEDPRRVGNILQQLAATDALQRNIPPHIGSTPFFRQASMGRVSSLQENCLYGVAATYSVGAYA